MSTTSIGSIVNKQWILLPTLQTSKEFCPVMWHFCPEPWFISDAVVLIISHLHLQLLVISESLKSQMSSLIFPANKWWCAQLSEPLIKTTPSEDGLNMITALLDSDKSSCTNMKRSAGRPLRVQHNADAPTWRQLASLSVWLMGESRPRAPSGLDAFLIHTLTSLSTDGSVQWQHFL